MSIFTDKKFESMDWISQATEPYEIDLDRVLTALPDEIPISIADLSPSHWGEPKLHTDKYKIILRAIRSTVYVPHIGHGAMELLKESFYIDQGDEVIVDLTDNTITGEIKLVKSRNVIPEKDAKNIITEAIRSACYELSSNDTCYELSSNDIGLSNLIDVTQIMIDPNHDHFKEIMKTKISTKAKLQRFQSVLLVTLVDLDRIRSEKVAYDFINIIRNYLVTGEPKFLGEIMRITKMMRSGQAIYSCSEKVEVKA